MFLFCLITFTSAYLAYSSELCPTESPCRCVTSDNKVIDISSVGNPEYPRFYEVPLEDGCNVTYLYSYNPCFPFDSQDKHVVVKPGHERCTGAAACIRIPGGPEGEFPEEYLIGSQSSAKFQKNPKLYNDDFYINYTMPGSKRNLIVILACNESYTGILEMEKTMICQENSDIVLRLLSKCACMDGCSSAIPPVSQSHGLSVGSKLLIAFFTILLAYLIIGMVWNFCNGSKGAELIPNLQFWNDLPTLIMEGVVFLCSCCGRQSSYGEV